MIRLIYFLRVRRKHQSYQNHVDHVIRSSMISIHIYLENYSENTKFDVWFFFFFVVVANCINLEGKTYLQAQEPIFLHHLFLQQQYWSQPQHQKHKWHQHSSGFSVRFHTHCNIVVYLWVYFSIPERAGGNNECKILSRRRERKNSSEGLEFWLCKEDIGLLLQILAFFGVEED